MMAPVILFVYNRPVHTAKVLDALSKAKYAINSDLIVFSDGPRDSLAIEMVEKTRIIIERYKTKFNSITIHKSIVNKGLGKSILEGINLVFQNFEKVIILEDDLIVHKDFLVYMNYNLENFENNREVYHISGFQKDSWTQFFLKSVHFTHFMNCWGWATWKNKWNQLILDNHRIDDFLAIDANRLFFNYNDLSISDQIELNRIKLSTWAIYWYSTIIINKGLCVNPKYSFVKNIGNDGSGTNMGQTKDNDVSNFAHEFIDYELKKIAETKFSKYHIIQAYSKKSKIRFKTLKNLIFNLLTKIRNIGLN